jgi:hypothetical protein
MAGEGQAGQPEDGPGQVRPLGAADRAVLHRVLGMVEGRPGYAGAEGLREAIGDGTRPQSRELSGGERTGLGGLIRGLIEEWDAPRLFREPDPAWDLSGADIARLGLIWRDVAPPPEDPAGPVVFNTADWSPPAPVPDGWVIATAPEPVQGPAGALSWRGEGQPGAWYAAWPGAEDDDAYWEGSGAREVLLISNREIAGQAGRYLAACGLLPGEAGLTAAGTARRLRTQWKEGVLDDGQAHEAALAAVLGMRRDDEDKAYDSSDGPQRRELSDSERAFLARVIGLAATDPRFGGEIIRRPVIRAVLGDGSRPQARPLTARERDDIMWLVSRVRAEWIRARERPGTGAFPGLAAGLGGGDVARLDLIGNAVTPRHGDPYMDGPVLVNAAGWSTPEPVPDGWATGNAPVPLSGPLTWRGPDHGNGEYYAADPDDDGDAYGGWLTQCTGTREVKVVTDEDIVAGCYAFLGRYGCYAPEEAGMTIAGVARDLGYPPLTPGGAAAAADAARAVFVLRAGRADGDTAWYAVHGTARRDRLARTAPRDGWQVTAAGEIPVGDAPDGAAAMAALALGCGWDLACTSEKGETEMMAVNWDTGERVSQVWDARGRLVRPGDLEKITASPRPLCMRPGGAPAAELLDPVACGFPGKPAAAQRRGGRPGRSGSRAAGSRRAGRGAGGSGGAALPRRRLARGVRSRPGTQRCRRRAASLRAVSTGWPRRRSAPGVSRPGRCP